MAVNLDWNNLGFKYRDTAGHMEYVWKDGAWDAGTFVEEPWLRMHIAAACLHYGQECFEGLKVFRQKDGREIAARAPRRAARDSRPRHRSPSREEQGALATHLLKPL